MKKTIAALSILIFLSLLLAFSEFFSSGNALSFSLSDESIYSKFSDKVIIILISAFIALISAIFIFIKIYKVQRAHSNIISKQDEQFRGFIESIDSVFWGKLI